MPVVYGAVVRDYARITFEWPENAQFKVKAQGRKLTITFDRAVNSDFEEMLRALAPYVISAERKAGGKSVVLTMNRPYPIRTFISDNINGVDLLKIDSKIQSKQELMSVVDKRLAEAKRLAALVPAAGEEASPAPAAVEEKKPEAAPEPAPVVEEKKPATVPVAEKKPEPVAAEPAKIEPPAPIAEEEKPEPAPAPVAEKKPDPAPVAEEPKIALPEASEMSDAEALAAAKNAGPAKPDPSGKLKVNLSAGADNAVLRFPFTERVAMAVFVRTHTLWVVFNKKMPLDLKDFEPMPKTVIGKPEIITSATHTILRLPIDDGVNAAVTKEENNFDWAVLITPQKRELNNPIPVAVNTDPPVPPHVFLPTLEIADPVTVIDPQIGDQLIITPLYKAGEGVGNKRDFVEFSLLATAQGAVVNKKADDVTVVLLRNGLRISLPQGATLTPGLPVAAPITSTGTSQSSVTLFPYAQWKPEIEAKRRKQLRELFQRAVSAETQQESSEARQRAAQIYLGDGMAVEAIGYLDGINRTNPAFYRSNKLAAMRGAANFLLYRFTDAARDFSATELNDNKEIDYWRSMLSDLLGNSEQSYDYLALNPDYISKYPPIFRQRLSIVAADRSIAAKEYNTALKVFDTLEQDNLLEPIHPYINFLLAKISMENGQEEEGLAMLDKLADDYDHPFVRARGEFSRIVWQLNHDEMSRPKAIDRLERLRLAWHGDSLELNIGQLLGELYVQEKDYISAMRIWHGIVTGFPNTSYAQDMARKMQEAFVTLFQGDAQDLSVIDALVLYNDYRNYAPSGATGEAIASKLADKLISIDLLDQAASLLDRQMKFEAEKEKRSELGAKLALVYLLNHQPTKALQALQDSVYGENAMTLRQYRNRLTAQAMIALGQSDKALQTLGQDNSEDAERLRIDVYWIERDWPRLTASIEQLFQSRIDVSAPLTLDESEHLLKLALAYIFQNDTAQLGYLRDYFGPLMAGNPYKPAFDFIASGDIRLTTTNFDEVLKFFTDTRAFIKNYKAEVKTAGFVPKLAQN